MRLRWLPWALAFAATGAGYSTAADVAPLPVVPDAEQVVAHTDKETASVEFDVRDPYPALKTIDYLVRTLGARGWTLAVPARFESPSPAERPIGARVYRGRHVWVARWHDPAGNETTYQLVYDCPLEQHGMHSVFVHASGSRYGKQEAERRAAERERSAEAERERKRAEFCSEIRLQSPQTAKLLCGR